MSIYRRSGTSARSGLRTAGREFMRRNAILFEKLSKRPAKRGPEKRVRSIMSRRQGDSRSGKPRRDTRLGRDERARPAFRIRSLRLGNFRFRAVAMIIIT